MIVPEALHPSAEAGTLADGPFIVEDSRFDATSMVLGHRLLDVEGAAVFWDHDHQRWFEAEDPPEAVGDTIVWGTKVRVRPLNATDKAELFGGLDGAAMTDADVLDFLRGAYRPQ